MAGKFFIVILVFIGILFVSIIGFVIFSYFVFKNRSTSLSYKKRAKIIPKTPYLYLFRWFSRFFLTKNGITKLHRNISSLSIYTYIESRILTVKMYINGIFLYLALILVFALLFKNVVYFLICMIFAVVVREQFFFKRIDKIRFQLLQEELNMLASLRQEYVRTRSVTEAFESVNRGKYIERAVTEIHNALCAIDAEEKLEAFNVSTPLQTLQTLATISYIVENRGDAETQNGTSIFSTAIDMIADEVRMDIRKERTKKQLFGTIEFIPVVPIFAIAPLSAVLKRLVPGTSYIYDGSMGFIFTLIILSCSLVGYYIITNITRSGATQYDDRTIFDRKLMSYIQVRRFIARIRPRDQNVLKAKFKLLRSSLSRNNIDYLYLRKAYLCIGSFFISLFLIFAYLIVGRTAIVNNISGNSATGVSNLTVEEQEMLRIMDDKFLKTFSGPPVDEQLEEFIKECMPNSKASVVSEQMTRLHNKYNQFHNMVFKWWMIWICFAVSLVAYNIPETILKRRAKMIMAESEEDCLQLQTTIAIMMNTSTDTLELLECLYKNSRVFKSILIDCYQNYVMDPYQALRIAKSKAQLPEFRNMMDKLSLTVTQITIAEAFSDLVSERSHMLRVRESVQLHTLEVKRVMVKPFAMAPMATLIACIFIAPICILAFSMYTDIMSSGLLSF